VKTQIWIAVAVYVLVAIVKKRLHIEASLYTLLQTLSVMLFEKIDTEKAVTISDHRTDIFPITNQLNLSAF
jgi:hypothetical protein